MTALAGILGAGALFALLGFSATRTGSRLEDDAGCQGDSCDLNPCSLHGGCGGCSEDKSSVGWWPKGHEHYGDRR